jgi:hypothetical protein
MGQQSADKIRTGSDSDQPKSATDEEPPLKPFQPNPFEVKPLAGRFAPSSDFASR